MVGSGAGGGVIAAECAEAGKSVLVLEMGAYRNESDFKQLELPGYLELYYGGGLAASESGSIAILAGQTLGGGTVVNYMNCVRTPDTVLSEWAGHGLDGLDDPSFVSEHMEVVLERIGANTEATKQNGTHQRLMAGCDALGYEHRPIWRNAVARRRSRVLRLLLDGLPARLQALGDEDVAAGQLGLGRALRARAATPTGSWWRTGARRASRPPSRMRTARPPRSRSRRRRWSWPAARSSRPRCCCAAASAARPPARTFASIPPSW